MAAKRDTAFHFEGFDNPTTTPVPDVVFDVLLSRLKEAELKALLYIIRRTFGFKKDRDPISFNQFLKGITTRDGHVLDEGCGVRDRTTLSRALKSLEDMGVVISEKGMDERGENTTTVYSLRFKGIGHRPDFPSPDPIPHPGGVVGNSYHRSMNFPPPVVGNSYPQETELQQTVLQERNNSNIRKANQSRHNNRSDSDRHEPQADTRSPRRSRVRTQDSSESSKTGFQSVGDLLVQSDQKNGSTGRTTRQKAYPEDRQRILSYIDDFATEMGDEAPLQSSVSRVYNLYHHSGIPIEAFTELMYEARALTKEYSGNVKKKRGDQGTFGAGKNKFPYFMKILEERVKSSTQLPLVPEDVWGEAQKILESSVAPSVYDEQIAVLSAEQRAGELVLYAPSEYDADWIGQRLGKRIKEAVEAAGWSGPIVITVTGDQQSAAGPTL